MGDLPLNHAAKLYLPLANNAYDRWALKSMNSTYSRRHNLQTHLQGGASSKGTVLGHLSSRLHLQPTGEEPWPATEAEPARMEGQGDLHSRKLTWKPKKGPIKTAVLLKETVWVSMLVWGNV